MNALKLRLQALVFIHTLVDLLRIDFALLKLAAGCCVLTVRSVLRELRRCSIGLYKHLN